MYIASPRHLPTIKQLHDYWTLCRGDRALLHDLPSVHTLRAEPAAARERRRRLAEINDCRIASAHPQEQPSGAQLQSAWESVVGDAVDGFVPYFGRAHLYG